VRVMTPRLTEPVMYGARSRRPAKLGRLALFLVRSGAEMSSCRRNPSLPVISLVPAEQIVRFYSF